jgi:pyruvate/2-oxoglutarate dehydrogenase complex dihydrolipoamide dehydrogenase (E3) component
MEAIVIYLKRMLQKLHVPVITGTEVTMDLVSRENPDAVVIATGSRPIQRPVPGSYGPPRVLNVREVLMGEHPVGERILFIDENGGHHAASTVEFLADQGKTVHMVTSDLFVGVELAPLGDLSMTRQRLLQKGVTFETDVVIDEIDKDIVKGRDLYTNKSVLFNGYDTIVPDMGNAALDGLYRELKGKVRELYRIGDCVAPRGIDMAVMEGRKIGEKI